MIVKLCICWCYQSFSMPSRLWGQVALSILTLSSRRWWVVSHPLHFTSGNEKSYPLCRRLHGNFGWSECSNHLGDQDILFFHLFYCNFYMMMSETCHRR